MPIDPQTGMFFEGTYRQKGGPLSAILSGFNASRAEDMRRRRQAADMLQVLTEMQKSGENVEPLLGTPEGSSALRDLGIQPENVRGMYQQSPEYAWRQEISGIEDPTEMLMAGARRGLVGPEKLAPLARAMSSGQVRAQQTKNQLLKASMDRNIRAGRSPREAAEIAVGEVLMAYPDTTPEEEARLRAIVPTLSAELGALQQSQIGLRGAQAGLAGAKTETENVLRQPRLQKTQAEVTLIRATTALKMVQQDVARKKAAGTVTWKDRQKLKDTISDLAAKEAKLYQDAQAAMVPEAYDKAIAENRAAQQDARKLLTELDQPISTETPPPVEPAPVKKKLRYNPATGQLE